MSCLQTIAPRISRESTAWQQVLIILILPQMQAAEKYALIVAGGKGLRMGMETPKQFLLLKDKPVLMHTVSRFADAGCRIVLVLPESHFEAWENLCSTYRFAVPHRLVKGGNERFASVKNGLAAISGEGLVAIHDGVRPCISLSVIEQAFSDAATFGSSVVAVKPKDSIRMKQAEGSIAVDRNDYLLVQTPQVFPLNAIRAAYDRPYSPLFTDDASVYEAAGHSIRITPGDYRNIKITTPGDLELATLFL